MAFMIYGVSRNNRRGIDYEPPSGKGPDHPKSVDEMTINYASLYSKFKYGHSHDIKYTRTNQNTNVCIKLVYKPKFTQNFRKTNLRGPKKIWVPKDKIIYVVDALSSKVDTPILRSGQWMLTTHNGKKVYVPKLELRLIEFLQFESRHNKIIGSETIGIVNLHSVSNQIILF